MAGSDRLFGVLYDDHRGALLVLIRLLALLFSASVGSVRRMWFALRSTNALISGDGRPSLCVAGPQVSELASWYARIVQHQGRNGRRRYTGSRAWARRRNGPRVVAWRRCEINNKHALPNPRSMRLTPCPPSAFSRASSDTISALTPCVPEAAIAVVPNL
jgi:hypothetical protein